MSGEEAEGPLAAFIAQCAADGGVDSVLRFAVVDADVRPTGATTHSYGTIADGELAHGPQMASFAALAIVRYKSDHGFYLLYLNEAGEEMTDTWHETLDHALKQAEHEYEGIASKWITPDR